MLPIWTLAGMGEAATASGAAGGGVGVLKMLLSLGGRAGSGEPNPVIMGLLERARQRDWRSPAPSQRRPRASMEYRPEDHPEDYPGGWSSVRPMARGGWVTKPTLALLGEEGPEYVEPAGEAVPKRLGIPSANPETGVPEFASRAFQSPEDESYGLDERQLERYRAAGWDPSLPRMLEPEGPSGMESVEPEGLWEGIASLFGENPFHSSGEGAGAALTGLAALFGNYKANQGGRRLSAAQERNELRMDEAKQRAEREQREYERQFQWALERRRGDLKGGDEKPEPTVRIGEYDFPITSSLGQRYIGQQEGIYEEPGEGDDGPSALMPSAGPGALSVARAKRDLAEAERTALRDYYWQQAQGNEQTYQMVYASGTRTPSKAAMEQVVKDARVTQARKNLMRAEVVSALNSARSVENLEQIRGNLMSDPEIGADPAVISAAERAIARVNRGR